MARSKALEKYPVVAGAVLRPIRSEEAIGS